MGGVHFVSMFPHKKRQQQHQQPRQGQQQTTPVTKTRTATTTMAVAMATTTTTVRTMPVTVMTITARRCSMRKGNTSHSWKTQVEAQYDSKARGHGDARDSSWANRNMSNSTRGNAVSQSSKIRMPQESRLRHLSVQRIALKIFGETPPKSKLK